jgi:hypothetical protein
MNETSNLSPFTPEGWHTLTPRIVVRDAEKLVGFLRQVFGATGDYRPDRPSVIKIGDSRIMVSEAEFATPRLPSSTCMSATLMKHIGGLCNPVQVHSRSRRTCPMATVAVW